LKVKLPKCKNCGRPLNLVDETHINVVSWQWNEEEKCYEPIVLYDEYEFTEYVCGYCGEPLDDDAYTFFDNSR